MSQDNNNELPEDIEVVSPGQMLAQARESLNMSQQTVADKLNFRVTLVKAIENDQFDKSLPATFNRGYLKNYAKLVEVSISDILASYESLNIAEKQGAELQSFSKQTEKQAESNRLMWVSYFILLLLIGSSIMWWVQDAKKNEATSAILGNESTNLTNTSNGNSASTLVDEEKVDTAQQTIESDEVNLDEASLKTSPTLDEEQAKVEQQLDAEKTTTLSETLKLQTPNTELTEVNEQDNAAENAEITLNNDDNIQPSVTELASESNTAVDLAQPVAIEDEIAPEQLIDYGEIEFAEFTFSGDCWVNIYDATGERIAWGIKKAGYVMNISGQAPFKVTLGKPELVSIEYQNEAFDMSQFSRGNIAKFSLPAEQINE